MSSWAAGAYAATLATRHFAAAITVPLNCLGVGGRHRNSQVKQAVRTGEGLKDWKENKPTVERKGWALSSARSCAILATKASTALTIPHHVTIARDLTHEAYRV